MASYRYECRYRNGTQRFYLTGKLHNIGTVDNASKHLKWMIGQRTGAVIVVADLFKVFQDGRVAHTPSATIGDPQKRTAGMVMYERRRQHVEDRPKANNTPRWQPPPKPKPEKFGEVVEFPTTFQSIGFKLKGEA